MPVPLVETLNRTHIVRKVGLQLGDALTPVRRRLLADELDVQEGALSGAVQGAGGGPPDDPGRHVRHDVLVKEGDSESLPDEGNL